MKINSKPASTILATSVDNSEVVNDSSRNNKKLAISDFTKAICKVEKPGFFMTDTKQAITQLRQAFT